MKGKRYLATGLLCAGVLAGFFYIVSSRSASVDLAQSAFSTATPTAVHSAINALSPRSAAILTTTVSTTLAGGAFAAKYLADQDALTGWRSAPQPANGTTAQWVQLALAPAEQVTLEAEQFAGVTTDEYELGVTGTHWMRYSWLPWMSGGSTAMFLSGPGWDRPLTHTVALQPGLHEVSLRVLDLGTGPVLANVTLGATKTQFAWGSQREQMRTFTHTVVLTSSVAVASLKLEQIGSWGVVIDALVIRPLGQPINQVQLTPYVDGGAPGDLQVMASLDGHTWVTLARDFAVAPQTPQGPLVLRFPPASARYLRITGRHLRPAPSTAPNEDGGQVWMGFVEIEASLQP